MKGAKGMPRMKGVPFMFDTSVEEKRLSNFGGAARKICTTGNPVV
jgi:hypothetical protein